MRNSAIHDHSRRTQALLLGIAVIATTVLGQRPASAQAQSCTIPNLREPMCTDASIDGYKACYRDLYDNNVIPAFEAMAQCTHVKADKGTREVLEASAAMITGAVKQALEDIDDAVSSDTGAPLTCIGDLNAVDGLLQSFIDAERNAPDLDAYRRATYTPAHFTFFEDALLTARQNRAVCDVPLQVIRKQLVLLSALKTQHPDYCQILRQSASYESVSRIEGLAEWTSVDPDIHFDSYFNFFITWNTQCGYYDFSNPGQATVRNAQCDTLTLEYKQTLSDMNGVLGWLASNRNTIVVTSTAIAATIFSIAGYGASAGPLGALVGIAVGLIISGIEYIMLQRDIDALQDLIADREQKVKDVVAGNLITETEFNNLMTQLCTPWQSVVDQRVNTMLSALDLAKHLRTIDSYYTLSDSLHDWYNELFLWATTPGTDGSTFLDSIATQELLAQKNQFDQRIFSSRADQEVVAEKNALTNIKGTVTLLTCSNLSPPQRRIVKGRMNAGVNGFNGKCGDIMEALAVKPDQPVAFASASVTSDVVCAYKGFRNGVASLEIRSGEGFASNMTLKDSTGAVVAELSGISSDTDFDTLTGLPGFLCASDSGAPFGTSADTRLAQATYALRLQDNTLGFDESDAASARPSIQALDSQLRLKEITCSRQLGNTTFNIPRTADRCGIPLSP